MKLIAVSQRVDLSNSVGERRDALDQRWWEFFSQLEGIVPLILPNHLALAQQLLSSHRVDGFLLTGGNSLGALGGDAPERDSLDRYCIELAIQEGKPLLGVCRGMQSIQAYFHSEWVAVDGHVCQRQQIDRDGCSAWVNSYHQWGGYHAPDELRVTARARDGVIKAVEHQHYPLKGIMWHPERETDFEHRDLTLFRSHFQL